MQNNNIKTIDLLKLSKSLKKHIEKNTDSELKLSDIQEATAKSLGFSNFNNANKNANLFLIDLNKESKPIIQDEFWLHQRDRQKNSTFLYNELAVLIITKKSVLRFESPQKNKDKIYQAIKLLTEDKSDFGIISCDNFDLNSQEFYSIFKGDNKYISHHFNNENMLVFSGKSDFMSELIKFCLNIKKYSNGRSEINTIYLESSILHMFSHLYLQKYPYLSFDLFSEFIFLSEIKKRLSGFYEIYNYEKELREKNKNAEFIHYLSLSQLKDVYNFFHSELYEKMIKLFSTAKTNNNNSECFFFTFDRDYNDIITANKELNYEQ